MKRTQTQTDKKMTLKIKRINPGYYSSQYKGFDIDFFQDENKIWYVDMQRGKYGDDNWKEEQTSAETLRDAKVFATQIVDTEVN